MIKHKLSGLGTALITPFTSDGRIDYPALDRVLDIQLRGATDYIVVLGTTGEAATLTDTERAEVRRHIVSYVGGRLPLVLGVGGNCTARVVDELHTLADELTQDYAAILSVCPYYNKPNQAGLFSHFCAIAEASPVPVILYNVPGRTGVNLLPETVIRLWEAYPERIIAIKEASGKVDQIKHLITLREHASNSTSGLTSNSASGLLILSGDDSITVQLMRAGADGLISVLSNALPEEARKLVYEPTSRQQSKLSLTNHLLFAEGNPAGIKTVLCQMGVIENVLRLPLVSCTPLLQDEILEELTYQKFI